MTEIKYKTYLSNLQKGERPCYRAVPVPRGVISEAQLIRQAAESCGLSEATCDYIWKCVKEEILKAVRGGYTVLLPNFLNMVFSIKGLFDAANAEFDPTKNRLTVQCIPKGTLANALSDAVGTNITEGNRCRITSVLDAELKMDGKIASGEDVEIYAAGGTFLVDTTADDEGVWLEDMDGQVAAFGTVTASTATTLECVFATLPEPGDYKFVVATRGGLGSGYGVSIAKRNITIVGD